MEKNAFHKPPQALARKRYLLFLENEIAVKITLSKIAFRN
jgi:hypothetical protein